jgi:hypothetical protein
LALEACYTQDIDSEADLGEVTKTTTIFHVCRELKGMISWVWTICICNLRSLALLIRFLHFMSPANDILPPCTGRFNVPLSSPKIRVMDKVK